MAADLFEAAADPAEWGPAWARIAGAFGATSATMLMADPGRTDLSDMVYMPGWTPDALRLFTTHYYKTDPFIVRGQIATEPRAYLGEELVSRAEFERSELWNDFSRHHINAFHFLIAALPFAGGGHAGIGLHRPPDAEPFGAAEQNALTRLLPYLAGVARLRRVLKAAEVDNAARAASLDQIEAGLVVTDGNGVVIVSNAAADRLDRLGLLRLGGRGGPIAVRSAEATAQLRRLIAGAAQGAPGGTVLIARQDLPPLVATVSPLPVRLRLTPTPPAEPTRYALVVVRDPALQLRIGTAELAAVYGLTRTEAGMVEALAEGHSAEEIARRRGVSVNTVRVQIRAILAKTNARNLRDLAGIARRFARGAGALP